MLQGNTNLHKGKNSYREDHRGVGRMLLVSLVMHFLVVALLGGYLLPKYPPLKKPVYFVDLIHKPVAKPRSGRPDAIVAKKKKNKKKKKVVKKTAPKRVVKKRITPTKSTKVATKVVVKTPKKKISPQKKQPVKKVVPIQQESNPLDAIAQMRRRQRIAALKQELNNLAHDTPATTVPVGVVGVSGTQSGVDFTGWIKTYLSAAWALPSHYYQRGLVGKMLLRFDPKGRLIYYELISSSGDSFFDASIKRAVQQLQQLPSAPEKRLELIIAFDPKEMLN